MKIDGDALESFLVEWYQPPIIGQDIDEIAGSLRSSAEALLAQGQRVRLRLVVAAPADEVLYGLFTAASTQAVADACTRAGWRADRIIAGVQASIS